MKKLMLIISCFCVLFLCQSVSASGDADDIRVCLDGNEIDFDVSPRFVDGRTFVPVRALFEAIGMEVSWNDECQTVTSVGNGRTIMLSVGNHCFYCDGVEFHFDVTPQLIGDSLFAPVRTIAESIGCTVKWIYEDKNVSIISSSDKISGAAVVEHMRCFIDYQPIDFANIDGYTYLKVKELNNYGFDVTEVNGDYYMTRNFNKIPALIDEYKDELLNDKFKYESRECHSVRELWREPNYERVFDIIVTDRMVYADGLCTDCYNLDGDMYIKSDELEKYGVVNWEDKVGGNGWGMNNVLNILISFNGLQEKRDLSDLVSENFSGMVSLNHSEAHSVERGIFSYKNGIQNGVGYYMSFYMDVPRGTIYSAGEYENNRLKNGITAYNNSDFKLEICEVKNFEYIKLYPITQQCN